MAEGCYGDCRDDCMQYQIEGEYACQGCAELEQMEIEQDEELEWF